MDELKDARVAAQLKLVVRKLIDTAKLFAWESTHDARSA